MAIKTINDTHLTSIADAIRSKLDDNELYDDNGELIKYTPAEMAPAIRNLPGMIVKPVIAPLNVTENGEYTAHSGVDGYNPVVVNVPTGGASSKIMISGNIYTGKLGRNHWNTEIESNFFETENLNVVVDNRTQYGIFGESTELKTIPFSLNFDESKKQNLSYLFYQCRALEELPDINCASISSCESLFDDCRKITTIKNCYIEPTYTAKYFNGMFHYMVSLREIPQTLINKMNINITTINFLYNTFSRLYIMDELNGIPVNTGTITSNRHNNICDYCFRVKNITFRTDNGTPYIANWKNQTIDLSPYNGYALSASGTNSCIYGTITADKRVTDSTTYEALKNDPDWWTADIAYSRYNHDSAVATINSLPDTSAYLATAGGTNTIKFKGESGSATIGGAINTLTEEEIAVATAKGWTVTLV